MGSDYNTAGGHGPANLLRFFSQYAPGLTSEISGLIPGVAQEQLRAANEQVNPTDKSLMGFNELNLDQLRKYALPQAEIGQQVADSNAQAGARTNLSQITGAGGDAAKAAVALNKQTNPLYYNAADKANEAVNSVSLKGLSPGEAAAVERSNNQSKTSTGNLGLINPTNVISDAMNFGGAFNSKIPLANQTAANAAAVAAGGGVNPVSVALGQPSPTTATNFGSGQFQTTTPVSAAGPASNTFGFNQATYGTLGSSNAAAQSAGAQMAGQSSPAAIMGSI